MKSKFSKYIFALFSFVLIFTFSSHTFALAGCGNNDSGGKGGKDRDKCKKPKGANPVKTYTGNVNRTILDLENWGSVGEIPFVWERTANSRNIDNSDKVFGTAHNWTHSWQWRMSDAGTNSIGQSKVQVNFPDGGRVFYTQVSPTEWRPPAAIDSRIWQDGNNLYLQNSSGWRYRFEKLTDVTGDYYQMQDVRDARQNLYTLTYALDGTRLLTKVTEPAGRFFAITYNTVGGIPVIASVQTQDGRAVNYTYSVLNDGVATFVELVNAIYGDGTMASYEYSQYKKGAKPSLSHAVDPRYRGAAVDMKYEYAPFSTVRGFISKEINGKTSEVMYTLTTDGTNYAGAYANGLKDLRVYIPSQNGQLKSYDDGAGGVSFYTYASSGRGYLIKDVDPLSRTNSYSRTIYGNYASITKPDGSKEKWTRDNLDLPVNYTDELGHVTTWTRDANHLVQLVRYPNTTTEQFTYNGFGQVLTHVKRNGGIEYFNYDATGLLTSFTDALGNTTTYSYDTAGRVASRLDPRGNLTTYEYNERGLLTKLIYADGTFQSYAYDQFGNRTSLVAENGKEWKWTYDEFKRVKTSADPLNEITQYDYDLPGGICGCTHTDMQPTLITLPSGKKIHKDYDVVYRLTSETIGYGSPEAATTTYQYDLAGNVITKTDAKGNTTTYQYDLRNRKSSISDALGNTSGWKYDLSNNLKQQIQPDGQIVQYFYDSVNQLTSIIDPKTGVTKMKYDAEGNLLTTTDPNGKNYTYTYDLLNRQLSLKYPDGRSEFYTYDQVGNVLQYTTRYGQMMTCTYDSRNREIHCDWSDSTPDVTKTYDLANRLSTVVTSVSSLSYTYDDANRILSETQSIAGSGGGSKIVTYSYDADGNRLTVGYPSGSVVGNTYTARNQLATIGLDGPPPLVTYSYDLNGNRIGKSLENGVQATYNYDSIDRLKTVNYQNTGGTFAVIQQDFDALNRKKYVMREDGRGDVYTYDGNDQLANVKYNALTPDTTPNSPDREVTYTYDKSGNRLSVNDNGSVIAYVPNSLDQYTAVGADSLTYYLNLELKTYKGWTYTYDSLTRLTKATNGATTYSFAYDARNRCVLRTANGVKRFFYYDHNDRIEERDATDHLLTKYVTGRFIDELLVKIDSSGSVYYVQDGLGNTTHLTDATGNVVEKYRYDVFGNPTVLKPDNTVLTGSSFDNRFLFTGREYLADLKIYDYRNRFYSPELGRFLQCDPIRFNSRDINLYNYVLNNPVNLIDPMGLDELAPLDSHGARRDMGRGDANKEIHPGGPLPKKISDDIDRGCIGLCAAYQGMGQSFPENAPGTNCYLTEPEADKRKCKCGEENFVFAKQGQWKGGNAPKPDPKTGQVPNDSVSSDGGNYNYITKFPSTKSYAWMNHAVNLGFTPQQMSVSPQPVKDPHYPHEIWCSTCKKKK